MDYNEEAYQKVIKARALGRKIYFEGLYSTSLKDLAWARHELQEAEKNSTDVEKARTYLETRKEAVSHIRAILEGRIQEEKPNWTIYEVIGYKEMEECDRIFSDWRQRVCPEGYWMPGMK